MGELFGLGASMPQHELELYLHPMEDVALAATTAYFLQVFLEDLVLASQPSSVEDLTWLLRAALKAIHSIFPPLSTSGHTRGRDSISLKNYEKGTLNSPT